MLKADSYQLMLMPMPLRAEVAFRVDRLAAVAADRTPAAGNLNPPAAHRPKLGSRAPEASHRGFLGVGPLGLDLTRHQHQMVRGLVVAKAELAHPEGRIAGQGED